VAAKEQIQVRQQSKDDMAAVAEHRDKQAFERLFDLYYPKIKAFVLSGQPGAALLAEEVAQEVMIKIWNKAHTYNPNAAAVSTWIFTLARNARIDYLRKNGRHMSGIDPTFFFNDIADENADPFIQAQQQRSEEEIRRCLALLPRDQMQVLTRVYLDGKTHQEVSTVLNLPLGTVKSRIRLALKKLSVSVQRFSND